MSIKAILFDWDGTIVNTMTIKVKNASETFAEKFNIASEKAAISYERYSGISRKELFQLIAKENIGRSLSITELNNLSAKFTSRNIDSFNKNKVFDEKNREVLIWLVAKGYNLIVSSSALKCEIEDLAELLDIRRYFKEMLGSSDNFKKGKDHINYIKKKYRLASDQMMFVGNEKADIRLSGRLGITCVGIANGKLESDLSAEFADYVIPNLTDLKKVLANV
ncbi:hypothetical protein AC481_06430 [miscellaneous Crenarchaeota group archaeon SMTZ-80]|nr:MAG: hypothetical protein AC481_06430 [miscellaneous Crenarchaeota group archaeon SMTZ-80]KPJ58742.1 MAG: hypothetical protein AMJ42_02700 [Deltaproteobacteria bacterium DG_8]